MDEKKINRAFELLEQGIEHWDEVTRLIREAKAPQARFYVGQPVLVRGGDITEWRKKHFVGMSDNMHMVRPGEGIDIASWSECKPDPEAVSLINWLPADVAPPIAPPNHQVVWTVNEDFFALIPSPEWI